MNISSALRHWPVSFCLALFLTACTVPPGGRDDSVIPVQETAAMGVIVERADGRLKLVERIHNSAQGSVEGLGDLSHASVVFSRDTRYAFVFGRDGGLSKVDMLTGRVVKRILQAGNSIGGEISRDGRYIAASNYTPGGVRIFTADDLEPVTSIDAIGANGKPSKVVGLVEAPGKRLVFSLFDAGEIWIADYSEDITHPRLTKFPKAGAQPYDALLTPDGRYYIAGLFGEDGLSLLDLDHPEKGVRKILSHYGMGNEKLPVYKMPHLQGWALTGQKAFLPAVGHHEILVIDTNTWEESGRIPVHGQPVFAVLQPDGRQVWVNFAFPKNDIVQVIDVPSQKVVKTLQAGPAVLHLEFTPDSEQVWISVRDADRVDIYDTKSFERIKSIPAIKPSGIFFSSRTKKNG